MVELNLTLVMMRLFFVWFMFGAVLILVIPCCFVIFMGFSEWYGDELKVLWLLGSWGFNVPYSHVLDRFDD